MNLSCRPCSQASSDRCSITPPGAEPALLTMMSTRPSALWPCSTNLLASPSLVRSAVMAKILRPVSLAISAAAASSGSLRRGPTADAAASPPRAAAPARADAFAAAGHQRGLAFELKVHVDLSHRHLGQVVPDRHVLGELLLRDAPLHRQLAVLHATDVAVDDADMVLPSDELVALRMGERVLHLHAFQRLDHALDILARLVAGGLDRLLDGKDVLPGLPAVALVHHAARAAGVARVDVVDAHELVELLVVLVVLGGELAREVLEEVDAFRGALDVVRRDRLDAGRGRVHL